MGNQLSVSLGYDRREETREMHRCTKPTHHLYTRLFSVARSRIAPFGHFSHVNRCELHHRHEQCKLLDQ